MIKGIYLYIVSCRPTFKNLQFHALVGQASTIASPRNWLQYKFSRCHQLSPREVWLDTIQTINSCNSRPDICQCLIVQAPIDNMSKNKPSTLMTQVACESRLCSVVRSEITHSQETRFKIKGAVVYFALAAHTFSVGIKCQYCRYPATRSHWILTWHHEGLVSSVNFPMPLYMHFDIQL